MREQLSSRSFCRDLHRPPPLRRSCCIRVREDIVKDPDPSTFDAELAYASGSAPVLVAGPARLTIEAVEFARACRFRTPSVQEHSHA